VAVTGYDPATATRVCPERRLTLRNLGKVGPGRSLRLLTWAVAGSGWVAPSMSAERRGGA